jgi:predicted NAD/FAD-dependent oxidoreductase
MARVAVVGGGIAGLGAAWRLGGHGHAVTVFEAGPRLGGRVSTVERGPLRFDDGAQFVRTDTEVAEQALLRDLPAVDIQAIPRDVTPFDRAGTVGRGDDAQNAMPKWVYRHGLRTLPYLVASASRARVQLNWSVADIDRTAGHWRVRGEKDTAARFDAVLISTPPREAARLVGVSGMGSAASDAAALLGAASYRSIISVAFEPSSRVEAPGGAYALVNSDRKHAVSWLAFEEAKPGYIPDGHQVLVAQMADAWSAERLAGDDRELARQAARTVSGLLGVRLDYRWARVTRWPQALPNTTFEPRRFSALEEAGLFLAGDVFTGGRVHLALENGMAAGDRMAGWLLQNGLSR